MSLACADCRQARRNAIFVPPAPLLQTLGATADPCAPKDYQRFYWLKTACSLGALDTEAVRALPQVSVLERSYRFFWRHKSDVYHILWDLCRCATQFLLSPSLRFSYRGLSGVGNVANVDSSSCHSHASRRAAAPAVSRPVWRPTGTSGLQTRLGFRLCEPAYGMVGSVSWGCQRLKLSQARVQGLSGHGHRHLQSRSLTDPAPWLAGTWTARCGRRRTSSRCGCCCRWCTMSLASASRPSSPPRPNPTKRTAPCSARCPPSCMSPATCEGLHRFLVRLHASIV